MNTLLFHRVKMVDSKYLKLTIKVFLNARGCSQQEYKNANKSINSSPIKELFILTSALNYVNEKSFTKE